MYLATVVLLLFVFPVASMSAELVWGHGSIDAMLLTGKWFVFWAVGVRLFIAGMRQVLQPQFTAESIFLLFPPSTSSSLRPYPPALPLRRPRL